MEQVNCNSTVKIPWNRGKIVGQKAPFKLKEIWAIRVRLQLAERRRELALFNLAIDSKLRACDQGAGCLPRSDGGIPDDRNAAENSEARTIRDYPANTGSRWSLDRSGAPVPGKQSPPKPTPRLNTPIDSAVLTDSGFLGQAVGVGELWDTHAEAHKGHIDLPADEKPTGRPAFARAH